LWGYGVPKAAAVAAGAWFLLLLLLLLLLPLPLPVGATENTWLCKTQWLGVCMLANTK